jgi:hypothetical protein
MYFYLVRLTSATILPHQPSTCVMRPCRREPTCSCALPHVPRVKPRNGYFSADHPSTHTASKATSSGLHPPPHRTPPALRVDAASCRTCIKNMTPPDGTHLQLRLAPVARIKHSNGLVRAAAGKHCCLSGAPVQVLNTATVAVVS